MELHLLVETEDPTSTGRTLLLDGRHLQLTGPYATSNPTSIPPYACVSYVWGATRQPNPLFPPHQMSTQTLPALTSALRAALPPHSSRKISAFWIDAFCIPYIQPARSASLESMGYIYSAAEVVVAALAPELGPALGEMAEREWVEDREHLERFEGNPWIASVWTYQEIVNARVHLVTCMPEEISSSPPDAAGAAAAAAASAPVLTGETFLNRIGYSLHKLKRSQPESQVSSFSLRGDYPHLDSFEDLGADTMIFPPFSRPALQVISMLDRRDFRGEERNKYYSMIGALTSETTGRGEDAAGDSLGNLRRKVMRVCEGKGDWSYIYSATVRKEGGEGWRPSEREELRSILPWFLHGTGQSGGREEGRVWLEKVWVLRDVRVDGARGELGRVRDIVGKLPLNVRVDDGVGLRELEESVRGVLVSAGFTGTGEAIVLPYGLFFPQHSVPADGNVDVVICTELRWTFGRPGILVARGEESTRYTPGVLIGETGADLEIEEYTLSST